MSYKLQPPGVVRLADGAVIPANPANADWREYQAWVGAGNSPQAERTLTELKIVQFSRITQDRNATLQGLTADFDGDLWDADEATSARIANALTMIDQASALGIPTPSTIAWRTADNKDRTITITELVQMGAAVFMAQQTVWAKQAALKNTISAALDAVTVEAVKWD
jgi:hypothetical protein